MWDGPGFKQVKKRLHQDLIIWLLWFLKQLHQFKNSLTPWSLIGSDKTCCQLPRLSMVSQTKKRAKVIPTAKIRWNRNHKIMKQFTQVVLITKNGFCFNSYYFSIWESPSPTFAIYSIVLKSFTRQAVTCHSSPDSVNLTLMWFWPLIMTGQYMLMKTQYVQKLKQRNFAFALPMTWD